MALSIKKEKLGLWLLVTLNGKLDMETSPNFDKEVMSEVENGLDIALDVSKLQYISSMGLRSIMILVQKAWKSYHHVAICGMTGEVKRTITLAKFDALLEVYDKTSDLPFTMDTPIPRKD